MPRRTTRQEQRSAQFRDVDAEHIVRAYDRAKAHDPKLTQAEFMMKARPGAYRNRESAARYFRLLRDGGRSGKNIYAEATGERVYSEERHRWERRHEAAQRDLFQVFVKDAQGNYRSFNVEAAHGRSAFDNALLMRRIRERPQLLGAKAREWANRYNLKLSDLLVDDFEVRHVKDQRVPGELLTL